MVVTKVVPPQIAAGSVEEQLHYLYSRKRMLDRLISAMETYCQGTLPIARKGASNVVAGYVLESFAS